MSSRHPVIAAAALVWAAALAASAATPAPAPEQKTTNDAIYTKAQADGAQALYAKICADCHPFTVAEKKKPKDLPLGDEPFFDEWEGRPVRELISIIALTMPNDGSAVVTDDQATELVAYILQRNGFPAGAEPLRKGSDARIDRPKK